MLLNTFFNISSVTKREEINPAGIFVTHFHLETRLEPDHPIFKGHFPGNPVVPGVCQVQMITETLQSVMGKDYTLKEADNIKFLSMINPVEMRSVIIDMAVKELPEKKLNVSATLSGSDQVFLKFKGIYE
ncbi:MAG: hypothetical protein M0P58_10655 [Bacteroidales bacterium]|jgi:3-hydroxyacyl-[acyl-carrier-protein] dehydratase|nr:hypothetical protein [Bacteroidales bacterium]